MSSAEPGRLALGSPTDHPPTGRPKSEALWTVDAYVLDAIDRDPTYRRALVEWFALHGFDATKIRRAAISANADGYLALQVDRSEYVDARLRHRLDIVPLLADPPAARPGWVGPLAQQHTEQPT